MDEGVETSVFDGVGFVETAILNHAISSRYASPRQITVPFSFVWEGTETEYKIMNCLKSTYPQQFYRIIREQGEAAVACMRDSGRMDSAVKAEMEMIKLVQGAGMDVPQISDIQAQRRVEAQNEYVADRAEQILKRQDHLVYRDALHFEFKRLIMKGLSNLIALQRVETVPEILTKKPVDIGEMIIASASMSHEDAEELPDIMLPGSRIYDRLYGIADNYRRREEDKLAYLANQAEENLI